MADWNHESTHDIGFYPIPLPYWDCSRRSSGPRSRVMITGLYAQLLKTLCLARVPTFLFQFPLATAVRYDVAAFT